MEIPFEADAIIVPVHVNDTGYEKKRPPQLNETNQPPAQMAGGPAETISDVDVYMTMARLVLTEEGYVKMDVTDTSTVVSASTGATGTTALATDDQWRRAVDSQMASATAAATAPAAPALATRPPPAGLVPGLTMFELEFHRRQQLATLYPADIDGWTRGATPRHYGYLVPSEAFNRSESDVSTASVGASSLYTDANNNNNDDEDIDLHDVVPGHWLGMQH